MRHSSDLLYHVSQLVITHLQRLPSRRDSKFLPESEIENVNASVFWTHTRTPTHKHTHTYTHTHTHTRTHTHAHTHTHMHTRIHTHSHTHAPHPHSLTHARTHTKTHSCTRTHAPTKIYTHAHTHTHTHTHHTHRKCRKLWTRDRIAPSGPLFVTMDAYVWSCAHTCIDMYVHTLIRGM